MVAHRSLRGHIDRLFIGRGFVQLVGWVVTQDNLAVQPPLTIRVSGVEGSGYAVGYRPDLAEAGIADGMAAFDAVVWTESSPVRDSLIVVVRDANGGSCEITCPAQIVSAFVPRGSIELVSSRSISGWLFDPSRPATRGPRLLLNGEDFAGLQPGIERPDLGFDLGDGRKGFGFEVVQGNPGAVFRASGPLPERRNTLSLVSSGYLAASVELVADGEDWVLGKAEGELGEPRFVLASDLLDSAFKRDLPSRSLIETVL